MQVNEGEKYTRGKMVGYVVQENGCWEWVGAVVRAGKPLYGTYKGTYAHRWVYIHKHGPIPDGMQLDHLCRNTVCVNPDHLEAVTSRTNTLRGTGPTAQNARKTHCKHGHEFSIENTRLTKKGRDCRACDLARWDRRKHLRPSQARKALGGSK